MDIFTSDKAMTEFKKKSLAIDQILRMDGNARAKIVPVYNQFFIIHSETNLKKTLLGRFDGDKIVPLSSLKDEPFGVKAKNVGQRFLQEALLQDTSVAPLVIVKGVAGTAKTFYSLAAGLHQTLEPTTRK